MKNNWMSVTVAILDFISAAYLMGIFGSIYYYAFNGSAELFAVTLILAAPIMIVIFIVPAVLIILAGIFAIKKTKWTFVFVVNIIISVIGFFLIFVWIGIVLMLIAIPAAVLTAKSKNEFRKLDDRIALPANDRNV